jgi:hypothetical protein
LWESMRSFLALVDHPHVQGMAKDKRDLLLHAEVREPVPTVDALDGDDQILAERLDGKEEPFSIAGQRPVQEHRAALVQDAHVHRPRVKVDPAVVLVRRVVEVHPNAPPRCRSAGVLSVVRAPRGEGAWMSIKGMKLTKLRAAPERQDKVPPCAPPAGWTGAPLRS